MVIPLILDQIFRVRVLAGQLGLLTGPTVLQQMVKGDMMQIMTEDQMRNVSTIRLIKYRSALLRCHDTPSHDNPKDTKDELTKDSSLWRDVYATVKKVLDGRENV